MHTLRRMTAVNTESGSLCLQTPKLCTASQALCDERETNARIRAEADENRNRIWQQKFKVSNFIGEVHLRRVFI